MKGKLDDEKSFFYQPSTVLLLKTTKGNIWSFIEEIKKKCLMYVSKGLWEKKHRAIKAKFRQVRFSALSSKVL